MGKVTIKDVAEKAGVSVTSVSRVLNDRGYISNNLRNKVMTAVEELDYTPNEIARSFFKNETKAIALIVPTVENPYFGELTFWIEHELSKLGYHLFVGNSLNNPVNEREYLTMLKEQRVDGMIVGSHNMDIEEYSKIEGNIVSIERKIVDHIPMIESENYHGGELATKKLIDNGCKKIICIVGDRSVDTPANNRSIAYSDVMVQNNLKPEVIEIPFHWSAIKKQDRVRKIFESGLIFDGVFAGDDIMASYFLNTAKDFGLSVPNDFQLIGFDGTNQVQTLLPELTTVVQPIEEMAKKSVKVLLQLIKKEKTKEKYTFPVVLKKSSTLK